MMLFETNNCSFSDKTTQKVFLFQSISKSNFNAKTRKLDATPVECGWAGAIFEVSRVF